MKLLKTVYHLESQRPKANYTVEFFANSWIRVTHAETEVAKEFMFRHWRPTRTNAQAAVRQFWKACEIDAAKSASRIVPKEAAEC
jgi:menaquinone-dependent protoporphyrinogen IX oxidase